MTVPPRHKAAGVSAPRNSACHDRRTRQLAALEAFLSDLCATSRAACDCSAGALRSLPGAFLGKKRIYHPEPTFLHFPKLPALEFYPRAEFPWLDKIEAATAEIRSEFERVFAEDAGRLEPYIAYPRRRATRPVGGAQPLTPLERLLPVA